MSGKLLFVLAAAGGAAFLLTRKSEEPAGPVAPRLPTPVVTKVALPPLDLNLSVDERTAIQNALTRETNPENLQGFANSFDPVFPMAANVLRAQATNLQGSPTTGAEEPCCDDCADGHKAPCTPIVTGPAVTMGLPSFPTTFGVDIR